MTTYADKLTQWRRELQQLATELMENDSFEEAQAVVVAAVVVKKVHDQLAEAGLDEEEWISEGGAPLVPETTS